MTGSCAELTLPVSATPLCADAAAGSNSAAAPIKTDAVKQMGNDILWRTDVISLDFAWTAGGRRPEISENLFVDSIDAEGTACKSDPV
jgi:hypothetical protein